MRKCQVCKQNTLYYSHFTGEKACIDPNCQSFKTEAIETKEVTVNPMLFIGLAIVVGAMFGAMYVFLI